MHMTPPQVAAIATELILTRVGETITTELAKERGRNIAAALSDVTLTPELAKEILLARLCEEQAETITEMVAACRAAKQTLALVGNLLNILIDTRGLARKIHERHGMSLHGNANRCEQSREALMRAIVRARGES